MNTSTIIIYTFKCLLALQLIFIFNCGHNSAFNGGKLNDDSLIEIPKVYRVNAGSIYFREGPDISYKIIRKLHKNDFVIVDNFKEDAWCEVVFYNEIGWVYSSYLTLDTSHQPEEFYGWDHISLNRGIIQECNDCSVKMRNDEFIDNSIVIETGSNTDILFYLINENFDDCYYSIYLDANRQYKLKNIPEGKYYYKVIYGSQPIVKTTKQDCKIKFLSNPIYVQSTKVFNLNLQDKHVESFGGLVRNFQFVPAVHLVFDIDQQGKQNAETPPRITEDDFFNNK